jgi:hypothetical protein
MAEIAVEFGLGVQHRSNFRRTALVPSVTSPATVSAALDPDPDASTPTIAPSRASRAQGADAEPCLRRFDQPRPWLWTTAVSVPEIRPLNGNGGRISDGRH